MTKIIVNADDFGINKSVNQAIIQGFQNGIITSTSLLANGDEFEEAINLSQKNPQLSIGIHLALVGGLKPLSDQDEVRSLLDENGYLVDNHTIFIKKLGLGEINLNEVYKELDKQFAKICQHNIRITHVDGHQHMHILPQILPMVIALMKKYGINKMRIPDENYFFFNNTYNIKRLIGKYGLTFLARKARRVAFCHGIYTPRYFWGMNSGGNMNTKNLLDILNQAKKYRGSHEIMVHPGLDNNSLEKKYPWHYHWEEEYAAVTSTEVRAFIRKHNMRLINYGDLT